MLLTALSMRSNDSDKKKSSFLRKLTNFFLFFIYLGILPLYLLLRIWQPKKWLAWLKNFKNSSKKIALKSLGKKLAISFPILLFLLPVWSVGYFSVTEFETEVKRLQHLKATVIDKFTPRFELTKHNTGTENSDEVLNSQAEIIREYLLHVLQYGTPEERLKILSGIKSKFDLKNRMLSIQ